MVAGLSTVGLVVIVCGMVMPGSSETIPQLESYHGVNNGDQLAQQYAHDAILTAQRIRYELHNDLAAGKEKAERQEAIIDSLKRQLTAMQE